MESGVIQISKLVSFIVTTKNEEKYIGSCLASIRNQTYKNIEIIVVDSFSTDNTIGIVEKYADKIIGKDCIMPTGRNMGARYAKGNVLAFVDADVVLERDWLERLLPKLSEKVVAVAGDLYPEEMFGAKNLFLYLFIALSKLLTHLLNLDNIGNGGTAYIITREAFNNINGYTNKFTTAEDIDLSTRLRRAKYLIGFERKAKAHFSLRSFKKYGYMHRIIYWLKGGIQYLALHKVVPDWRR